MSAAVNYVGCYAAGGTRHYYVPGTFRERFRLDGGRLIRQATDEEAALAQANGAALRVLPLDTLRARAAAAKQSDPATSPAIEDSSTSSPAAGSDVPEATDAREALASLTGLTPKKAKARK